MVILDCGDWFGCWTNETSGGASIGVGQWCFELFKKLCYMNFVQSNQFGDYL